MRGIVLPIAALLLAVAAPARATWLLATGGEEPGAYRWKLGAAAVGDADCQCERVTTTTKSGTGAIKCDSAGRNGTGCAALSTVSKLTFKDSGTTTTSSLATLRCCFSLYNIFMGAADAPAFKVMDSADTALDRVLVQDNRWVADCNTGANVNYAVAVNENQWYRVCVEFINSGTTDDFNVWVDHDPNVVSTPDMDCATGSIHPANAAAVELQASTTLLSRFFDDVVCSDAAESWGDLYASVVSGARATGNSVTNVDAVVPASAGTCTSCDATSDPVQNCVNGTCVDTTDYIPSEVGNDEHAQSINDSGDTFRFTHENDTVPTGSTVLFVQMATWLRRNNANTGQDIFVCDGTSGTGTSLTGCDCAQVSCGTGFTLAHTTYEEYQVTRATQPGGGSWSIAEVNALETGLKRTNSNGQLRIEALHVDVASRAPAAGAADFFFIGKAPSPVVAGYDVMRIFETLWDALTGSRSR